MPLFFLHCLVSGLLLKNSWATLGPKEKGALQYDKSVWKIHVEKTMISSETHFIHLLHLLHSLNTYKTGIRQSNLVQAYSIVSLIIFGWSLLPSQPLQHHKRLGAVLLRSTKSMSIFLSSLHNSRGTHLHLESAVCALALSLSLCRFSFSYCKYSNSFFRLAMYCSNIHSKLSVGGFFCCCRKAHLVSSSWFFCSRHCT